MTPALKYVAVGGLVLAAMPEGPYQHVRVVIERVPELSEAFIRHTIIHGAALLRRTSNDPNMRLIVTNTTQAAAIALASSAAALQSLGLSASDAVETTWMHLMMLPAYARLAIFGERYPDPEETQHDAEVVAWGAKKAVAEDVKARVVNKAGPVEELKRAGGLAAEVGIERVKIEGADAVAVAHDGDGNSKVAEAKVKMMCPGRIRDGSACRKFRNRTLEEDAEQVWLCCKAHKKQWEEGVVFRKDGGT